MGRVAIFLLVLLGLAGTASASEFFEVGADSLLFSEIGTLVRVTDPGSGGVTLHLIESITWIRIYGTREYGSEDWEVYPTPVYLCPTFEMTPGFAWRFLDDDFGNARTAEAVGQEVVTVPAGTFANAWRVEVTRDDQPSVLDEVFWFVVNLGIVKHTDWEGGQAVYKSELLSSDVSGLGFFPLELGNTWQYTEGSVEAVGRSVGGLKALFRD